MLALTHYVRFAPNSSRQSSTYFSSTSWTVPKGGNLKLNVDCSWVEGELASSVAGLLQNSSGVIVEGFAKAIHASSPLQAETLAVLHGLRFLKKENDTHVGQVQESKKSLDCETDCRTVVESIMGRIEAPWAVKDLIQECQQILAQVPHAKLTHCSRDANYAADWVAKAFRLKTLPSGWQIEPRNLFGIFYVLISTYPFLVILVSRNEMPALLSTKKKKKSLSMNLLDGNPLKQHQIPAAPTRDLSPFQIFRAKESRKWG